MSKALVTAEEPIPFGARILVRSSRAQLAVDGIANATAPGQEALPRWRDHEYPGFRRGQQFFVTIDQDLGQRCLHAIANGPIMDANRLYLPAGKLTEAEYRERTARQLSTIREDQP